MRALAIAAATALLSAGYAAATTGGPGVVAEGDYGAGRLGRILQPAPGKASPDGRYGIGVLPLYPDQLAPGDGAEAAATYCDICHSLTYIPMQPPLSARQWQAVVEKMQTTFGAGEFIPGDAAALILKYLQEHYTLETRRP